LSSLTSCAPYPPYPQVSFFRPNLTFKVLPKPAKGNAEDGLPLAWHGLLEYIKKQPPGASGIVYCLSRQDTVDVAG
jgi:superfamily II DNA helicase RecQ